MKDKLGNELHMGDLVAYIASYKKDLRIGKVAHVYPESVDIAMAPNGVGTIRRTAKNVIKVQKPEEVVADS